MLVHIGAVMEIFTSFAYIHCIFGTKFRLNQKMMVAILSIFVTLELINAYQLSGIFSFVGYVIIFIYCKKQFKRTVWETTLGLLLYVITATVMQYICLSAVSVVVDAEGELYLICNGLALIIGILFLPKCNLHKLFAGICRKTGYVAALFSFMSVVAILILLQSKTMFHVEILDFILVVPAIILLLYSILKWHVTQAKIETLETEIQVAETNEKGYQDLLTKVRLRQHEFKNHMAAILSAHYTYKSYEKLVEVQEKYCSRLLCENKYNNLLMLGNSTLVGFLYRKLQDLEEEGIVVQYKVATHIDKMQVPTYYVIEILGILLDNAAEAMQSAEEKDISFEARETEDSYEFLVGNPFPYVSMNEILKWFQLNQTNKGEGRGLGLYHVKCICEELNCEIECGNKTMDEENWIVFTLRVGKTDNEK